MGTNQFTKFSIILYELPTDDLLCLLGVKEYAFIYHDKDLENDGTIKKPHYHLYINLYRKKTPGGIFEILIKWKENCSQAFLIKKIDNEPAFIRYLIHIDDKDKYQYKIDEIITNLDIEKYFYTNLTDTEFTTTLIQLINNGIIKSFKEITKYSIDNGKLELLMKRAYFFKSLL